MNYQVTNNIATLTIDDGKANVVGQDFLDKVNAALDRAEAEQAGAVILKGREGMFSGGFDLGEFKKGREQGMAMVGRGFELLVRLYSFPLPLVAACTGHGIAMGAFIIMACDRRIGTLGDYKMRRRRPPNRRRCGRTDGLQNFQAAYDPGCPALGSL